MQVAIMNILTLKRVQDDIVKPVVGVQDHSSTRKSCCDLDHSVMVIATLNNFKMKVSLF
jgi:hypothetical protein